MLIGITAVCPFIVELSLLVLELDIDSSAHHLCKM